MAERFDVGRVEGRATVSEIDDVMDVLTHASRGVRAVPAWCQAFGEAVLTEGTLPEDAVSEAEPECGVIQPGTVGRTLARGKSVHWTGVGMPTAEHTTGTG